MLKSEIIYFIGLFWLLENKKVETASDVTTNV
jgi:hypothetical protein